MFKRIKDKYLKIIYNKNKNTFYGDHVMPSLLLPVCNLISAATHFVNFLKFYCTGFSLNLMEQGQIS